MRTHLEFRAPNLVDPEHGDEQPSGESAARYLAERLPEYDFKVLDVFPEDWGWCVRIANDAFYLWIGCGPYLDETGHIWFIEPSKPYVRRWFKRVSTVATIERLAVAIERIAVDHAKASDLRWWAETEVPR